MDVSVIICSYNRCESLEATLRSLFDLVVDKSLTWEILVVDNNSTDRTKEIITVFASKAPAPTIYVFEAAPGLSEARNAGLRHATGEIISFIDDDVLVHPDWLSEVCKGFAQVGTACLGGKALLPRGLKYPRWWDHSYDGPIGECNPGEEIQTSHSRNLNIIGANLSFHRMVFEKYGLFSPKVSRRGANLVMGEETDFIRRLHPHGLFAGYYPKAIVYHVPSPSRMTISYLSRWYFRRGEWEWYANKDRPLPTGAVVWFGAPRWIYGDVLKMMLMALSRLVCLQFQKAVYYHMQVSFNLGYLVSYLKARHSGLAQPVAGTEVS